MYKLTNLQHLLCYEQFLTLFLHSINQLIKLQIDFLSVIINSTMINSISTLNIYK